LYTRTPSSSSSPSWSSSSSWSATSMLIMECRRGSSRWFRKGDCCIALNEKHRGVDFMKPFPQKFKDKTQFGQIYICM
jgi:hypothetical protein